MAYFPLALAFVLGMLVGGGLIGWLMTRRSARVGGAVPPPAAPSEVVDVRELAASLATRHDALADLFHWYVWLSEKIPTIVTAQVDERVRKVRHWHGRLDYYLHADPLGAVQTLPGEERLRLDPLLNYLTEQRISLQGALYQSGVERICPEAGTAFIAGVVERDDGPPVITQQSALHDTVASVEPGQAGYRIDGQVVVACRARRYEARG